MAEGVLVGFRDYFRIGLPVTVATLPAAHSQQRLHGPAASVERCNELPPTDTPGIDTRGYGNRNWLAERSEPRAA